MATKEKPKFLENIMELQGRTVRSVYECQYDNMFYLILDDGSVACLNEPELADDPTLYGPTKVALGMMTQEELEAEERESNARSEQYRISEDRRRFDELKKKYGW